MAVSKQKKVEIMDELRDVLKESSVLLLTTRGSKNSISSQTNYQYRAALNAQNTKVMVAKNTLIRLALQEKGIDINDIVGQTYVQVIPGGDEVSTIKIVMDIVNNKFTDNFTVFGSVVNGQFMNPAQTELLSKVPSFNQSMSMIAGALNNAISKIAIGINEVPTGVARGVLAMSSKS